MKTLAVGLVLACLLSFGCVIAWLFEYATHDVACEAYNTDVECGVIPGPKKT